jgi:hypothetical protein
MKAHHPFKDEAKWASWWANFKVTLSSQGMDVILDPDYKPQLVDESLDFIQMQGTAFAIVNDQIQTPVGIFIE